MADIDIVITSFQGAEQIADKLSRGMTRAVRELESMENQLKRARDVAPERVAALTDSFKSTVEATMALGRSFRTLQETLSELIETSKKAKSEEQREDATAAEQGVGGNVQKTQMP